MRDQRGSDQPRRNAKGRTRNRGTSGQPRKRSAQAPSQRTRKADPARRTAFTVLRAVSAEDAYANLVLPQEIRRAKLNKLDAGFATELTYGTLRWQGTYDAILETCIEGRDLSDLDGDVLDVLRMGSHQLLHMRVPAHAALNSTVGLAREHIGAGPSGFINAVLRKVSEKTVEEWLEALEGSDADQNLAVRTSHPRWMVRALRQALVAHGRDAADIERVLSANNDAPALNLIALPGGIGDLDPVLEYGAEQGPLVEDSAIFSGGDAGRIPGVREGTVRVQDVGSQLAARALVAPDVETGTTGGEAWLDMCAGPGGKAALLAALAAQREGTTLLANEVSPHRTDLVASSLRVIDESVWRTRTGDGRTLAEETDGFDRILLDAPCTGMGALRRRPESRWRRTMSDLATLAQLQRELLDAAVELLKPGGVLAYVTCSPHQVETVLQVHDVLTRHPEMSLLNTVEHLQSVARHTPDGASVLHAADLTAADPDQAGNTAQLWSDLHSTDAMFVALLRKS